MFNELAFRRTSMIKLKVVAASAILSAVIANPAFAQAIIQESGAHAKNYATADLAIGAPLSSPMAINKASLARSSLGRGSPPIRNRRMGSLNPIAYGWTPRRRVDRSSSSTVWPAPVGHHQPRVTDIPSSVSTRNTLLSLDQEDASVDRKIGGICRGC